MASASNSNSRNTKVNAKRISNMTLLAIALASSKRAQPAFVRAFSQSGFRTPAASMGLASNVLLRNEEARKSSSSSSSSSYPFFHIRESSSKTAATVEEDLDSALDEILGSAFKEAGDDSAAASLSVSVVDTETEGEADTEADTEVAAAASEVEEKEAIPVDFTNPKFLSTTNPYWVNAGMEQKVIDVLSGKGITRFTEVQGKAFEPVLEGRDVIGRSRTGTGKTLAFGLPGAHRLVKIAEEEGGVDSQGRRKRGRNVSMIALCPTRELARQVEEEISHVARPLGLFTTVFHGGVSYDPQVRIIIYTVVFGMCLFLLVSIGHCIFNTRRNGHIP